MHSIFRKKYPVIKQNDQVDCGPAVLLTILKHYHNLMMRSVR
ncbi:MAG: cysteine peptidase family C39 domain-containing protein [Bacteroidota bacterium]